MEDQQRQQWQRGGLEASHVKELFRDHSAMKLMDALAGRDVAMAEREAVMAERKTAYAERDAALLQRDVAYADRNAAWMERDTAVAALSMVRANRHDQHHHHHSSCSNGISFNTATINNNTSCSSSSNSSNNSNNNNNNNCGSLSSKDCPSPDYASNLMLVHLPHIDPSARHHHHPPPPHPLLQTFPDCHNGGALRGLKSARKLQSSSSKQQEDGSSSSSTPWKRTWILPSSTPNRTLPKDPYHCQQQQQLLRSPDVSYPKEEQQGTAPTTADATTTGMAMAMTMATATTEPSTATTTTGLLGREHPYDMLSTPIPYCSCTGSQQQCYRWGKGGWQSACCTNVVSVYPLPMSSTKRGARIPGRKMSGGAFQKIVDKLSADGIDVSLPIDLKDHWAKHGTNRYVTIK